MKCGLHEPRGWVYLVLRIDSQYHSSPENFLSANHGFTLGMVTLNRSDYPRNLLTLKLRSRIALLTLVKR